MGVRAFWRVALPSPCPLPHPPQPHLPRPRCWQLLDVGLQRSGAARLTGSLTLRRVWGGGAVFDVQTAADLETEDDIAQLMQLVEANMHGCAAWNDARRSEWHAWPGDPVLLYEQLTVADEQSAMNIWRVDKDTELIAFVAWRRVDGQELELYSPQVRDEGTDLDIALLEALEEHAREELTPPPSGLMLTVFGTDQRARYEARGFVPQSAAEDCVTLWRPFDTEAASDGAEATEGGGGAAPEVEAREGGGEAAEGGGGGEGGGSEGGGEAEMEVDALANGTSPPALVDCMTYMPCA